MKSNKGIILFEVALVVLLVSIISFFLFRGYGLFIKAGKKSLNYLRLMIVSEEKLWDLQWLEKNSQIDKELKKEGVFDTPSFNWTIALEDTSLDFLKKVSLRVSKPGRKTISLDTIIYLHSNEENE